MLVLTRSPNEIIDITLPDGRKIEIQICAVTKAGKVRVGVTAPFGVPVHRREVTEQIEASGFDHKNQRPVAAKPA